MSMDNKKIGIIGIGNCGGQIAKLAEKKYSTLFDVAYINTSDADLAMATSDEHAIKFKIGANSEDGDDDTVVEGSGKNRSKMKDYLRKDIKNIISNEDFQDMIFGKKYIFVCMSAAGGTGSGAGPIILDIMKSAFVGPHFILLTVLPQLSSSLMEQGNTMECMDELFKTLDDQTTYMIYDNETRVGNSPTRILEMVNEEIVEDLRVFTGIDNMATQFESIDDADMESILTTPGRVIVSRITTDVTEKIMEDDSLDKRIIKSIKDSAHAEIDYNGKVSRYGIITFFTENVNNMYDCTLSELQKYTGTPVERFNHNAINGQNEKKNFIHFIASGLSPINDRIAKTVERIEELKALLAQDDAGKYKFDGSASYNMMEARKKEDQRARLKSTNIQFDDFFSKFQ